MNNKTLNLSIVIAFHNHAKMTIRCIESIYEYGPQVKEIIVISNNSTQEELSLVQNYAETTKNTKVLIWDNFFNYQKEYNWGVGQATSKFVLMLNNDTELRPNSRGLIERMYKKASLPEVGIVGCTLLYGDEKQIQHAGIYLMPEGLADHMYVRKSYDSAIKNAGTKQYPYDISEDIPMTAVTGAAQLVEKSKFDIMKGFDEKFIVCGGDVDLCIRHNKAGYQTWFVGGGYILHKESVSRKFDPIPAEDFFNSYYSYIEGYDPKVGDPFLPEITKTMKINGV
jgi:GT2 family glycosyltransferase